jgi:hypothetical protein
LALHGYKIATVSQPLLTLNPVILPHHFLAAIRTGQVTVTVLDKPNFQEMGAQFPPYARLNPPQGTSARFGFAVGLTQADSSRATN